MVTVNGIPNIFGTIICFSILITPIIIAAILGTRSRIKYAKQIRQNQANGLYKDWNKPPISNRVRALVLSGLISVLGMVGWFITGLINSPTMFSSVRLIVLGLFIFIGIAAGFILQRMVAKGK